MNWFIKLFRKKEESANVYRTLSRNELRTILHDQIKWSASIYEPYMADKEYLVPHNNEFFDALRDFDPGKYRKDINDCDNIARKFSQLFPGESVGDIYIKGDPNHVVNFFVDVNSVVHLYDPSSKQPLRPSEVTAFRGDCI